jgi:hypothetical protein
LAPSKKPVIPAQEADFRNWKKPALAEIAAASLQSLR